jgi:hypothetical protein
MVATMHRGITVSGMPEKVGVLTADDRTGAGESADRPRTASRERSCASGSA